MPGDAAGSPNPGPNSTTLKDQEGFIPGLGLEQGHPFPLPSASMASPAEAQEAQETEAVGSQRPGFVHQFCRSRDLGHAVTPLRLNFLLHPEMILVP